VATDDTTHVAKMTHATTRITRTPRVPIAVVRYRAQLVRTANSTRILYESRCEAHSNSDNNTDNNTVHTQREASEYRDTSIDRRECNDLSWSSAIGFGIRQTSYTSSRPESETLRTPSLAWGSYVVFGRFSCVFVCACYEAAGPLSECDGA